MRRPYTPSIPTVESLRRARERLNRRRRRQVFLVLRALHRGAALHFCPSATAGDLWTLSTGETVAADAAAGVIKDPRITAVDFALLGEVPAATWRWVGSDLPTTKPTTKPEETKHDGRRSSFQSQAKT
jgi:hypothetical protein